MGHRITLNFIEDNSRFYVDFIEEFVKQRTVNYLRTIYPNITDENELLATGDIYSSRDEALARIQSKIVGINELLEHEETKRFITDKGISEDYFKKTLFCYARRRQSNLIRVSKDCISLLGFVYSPSCKEKMIDTYQCSLEWCLLAHVNEMSLTGKKTHCSRLK